MLALDSVHTSQICAGRAQLVHDIIFNDFDLSRPGTDFESSVIS